MASRRWRKYEREKGKLAKKPLTPAAYEAAIKEIAKKKKL